MMERIVDKIVPDETGAPEPSSSQLQPAGRSASASSSRGLAPGREPSVDVLQASAAGDGPIAALLAMRHESVHRRGPSESGPVSTPALTTVEPATPTFPASSTTPGAGPRLPRCAGRDLPSSKHFWVCTALYSIIPPESALETIVAASPGAPYVAALCYSDAERQAGKVEPTSSLAKVPPLSSHPLLLARHALQIIICIQQLPPGFDWDAAGTGYSMEETINRLSSTSLLVTSNDDLIGYAEGLACLLLQGVCLANSGSLRKAWFTLRRAINLAQVMGIDRGHSPAFRSCDPTLSPPRRSSARLLWYRLVSSDRYLSLLLGLPVGSQGNEFASEEVCEEDTPTERLEKVHTALSARILERNRSQKHRSNQPGQGPASSGYAAVQEIDLELEAAAKSLPPGWWDEPVLDSFTSSQGALCRAIGRLTCQIHHFTLLLLLHAPYMLYDPSSPRYDYSKTTCMASARELLARFITFRGLNVSPCNHKRVDYAALIAAMTLCLAYLGRRKEEKWDRTREDGELVEAARRRMEQVAGVTGDRLSREIMGIIEPLLSIINKAASASVTGSAADQPSHAGELQFNVPYLGSISIYLTGPKAPGAGLMGPAPGPMDALGSPSLSDAVVQFAPYDDQARLGPGAVVAPELTADGEDWALQGIDSAFWSLFEGIR